MRRVLAAVLMLTACFGEPKRRVQFKDIADSNGVPTPPPPPFQAPDEWETVTLRNGMTFRQPEAFTFGLGGARLRCDEETPGADSAVFPRDVHMTWPLTLSMRRGDLARIAFNNGFTIDSTEMAEHGTSEVPVVRRGEGWFLL